MLVVMSLLLWLKSPLCHAHTENECSPVMFLLANVNVGIDLAPNQICVYFVCVCLCVQLCVCVYMAAWQRNTEGYH